MGLLGKIWVKLGLDNSEFDKGIKESQGAASQFKNFIGGIGKAVVGAFSVTAIINFAKASIKAYNESALALAKLENILKSTGNASGFTSQQLQNYAMQLQRVTKFEDDTTIAAMGVLASFKNIRGDIFKGVIKTAMDLSTVIGGDLQSNVYQLAKALERPAEGIQLLNRSTRAFSEAQIEDIKKLVAEGKTREAQMVALNTLNERFGGSAEAAADTAEGAWTRVTNAIGNLMEKMGEASNSTKGFANVLASTLEFLGSDSGKITFWQKLGLILGSPQALNNMAKVSEQMNASRKAAEDYANTAMRGIKSVADAEAKLLSIEGLKSEGWDLLREKLVAYLAENKKVGAVSDENADKSDNEKKAIEGTIPYQEKKIKLLQEDIALTTDAKKRAALNQELANAEHRLAVMKLTTAELKAYNDLIERAGKRGSKTLPSVENNIAPDGVKLTDKSFMKLPKDAQKDFFGSSAYKKNIEGGKKAVKDMEQMIEEVEALNQRFNDAIVFGISDALQTLVDELIETGKVDVGSVVTALVSPFGDMLIQLGEVALMSAIGIEAIKDSFSSMNPAIAAAAGVALIALGSLVKAGVAQIGKSGGKSSGMSNTSFTGGSYIPQPAVASANGNDVMAVIKGEDIWLINKKVDNRKGR